MLRSLVVKDFAIIDAAELSLAGGMTALTGETGAGKSLIVDALMLLGGARADAGFVRHGCERALYALGRRGGGYTGTVGRNGVGPSAETRTC